MASRDKKPAKPSSSRTGGIHTLSDFQHYSSDSDSNPDGHQEYYTGGEKSGMLVQDPQKFKDVDALFSHVRQLGAVEGPIDHPSSPRILTGTGRSLSGNTVSPASQHPEAIIHTIIFWSNGFTVNDGPLRRLDAPENAAFLESIQKSECPKELEPADKRSSVSVHLIRKNQECPGPAKRQACFQGVGRSLAGSSSEGGSEPTAAASQPPPTDLAVDETKPKTSIQLRLADGTRVIARFNLRHTVGDIRGFIEAASRPGTTGNYQLQMVGFPPKLLGDPNQTIEEAGLAKSVVIQKF